MSLSHTPPFPHTPRVLAEEYDPAYFDSDEEVTFDDDDDEAQAGEAAGREAGASGPKSKAAKGRVAAAQSSKVRS